MPRLKATFEASCVSDTLEQGLHVALLATCIGEERRKNYSKDKRH